MEVTRPCLTQLTEFKKILNNYQPDPNALESLRGMRQVLLIGPVAAGRNTLINILVRGGDYHSILSDTTRPKRYNNGILEQDGVEYWFKTEAEFLEGLHNRRYIEAALIHQQQVSGVRIDELGAANDSGRIAINEVQVDGAAKYHSYIPNILCIFLLPPSFDTWMERIRGRGPMDDAELRRRLQSAEYEITTALAAGFYTFTINHEIHEAAHAVDNLVKGELPDQVEHEAAKAHAEQLLIDVRLSLEN